jgi:TPR repeat protein
LAYFSLIAQAQDFGEAKRAAEQGVAHAQYCFGKMYELGHQEAAQNYVEAAEWYRKAAEQGTCDSKIYQLLLWRKR